MRGNLVESLRVEVSISPVPGLSPVEVESEPLVERSHGKVLAAAPEHRLSVVAGYVGCELGGNRTSQTLGRILGRDRQQEKTVLTIIYFTRTIRTSVRVSLLLSLNPNTALPSPPLRRATNCAAELSSPAPASPAGPAPNLARLLTGGDNETDAGWF